MRVLLAALLISATVANDAVQSEAGSDDQSRVKRIVMPGVQTGETTAFDKKAFPMILPPYNISDSGLKAGDNADKYGSCLLYSEGVSIIVYNGKLTTGQYATADLRFDNISWAWNDDDVACSAGVLGNYNFKMNLITKSDIPGYVGTTRAFTIKSGTTFTFSMGIQGDNYGNWRLVSANLSSFQITKEGTFLPGDITVAKDAKANGIDNMGMNSVAGWAWGCYSSQAVFFGVDGEEAKTATTFVGISLYNTEIQPVGAVVNGTEGKPKSAYFTLNMDDCTGTFSTGSWMGIVSALTLLFGLFFGYLMLQAVKTMDRFDDPKQKQIIINVRE